jgi:hypothetical protein
MHFGAYKTSAYNGYYMQKYASYTHIYVIYMQQYALQRI